MFVVVVGFFCVVCVFFVVGLVVGVDWVVGFGYGGLECC